MKNDHLKPRESVIPQGEPAPDFTLLTQSREPWTLTGALEKGDVVLSFYPMAFTEVCGSEMDCINKEMARWTDQGAQVVGISTDSFATQKAWADANNFQQPLLADMHREVCKAYGLYWADLNVTGRGTVIVTKKDGKPVVKWSQGREPGKAFDLDEVLGAMA